MVSEETERTGAAGSRKKAQPRLDRDLIVAAALRLLNEVGLEGLTLRKLAAELNVQAPALYWHVKNKQQLLDEMATGMLAELRDAGGDFGDGGRDGGPDAAGAGADWQSSLAQVFRLLRRTLLRHRDGAKVFAGTRLTDTGHAAVQERHLGALVGAGFTPRAAARAVFLVFVFTEGFVIEEQTVWPMPGERAPGYDVAKRAAAIGEGFPLSASAGADLFADHEERFEEGLTALIAGIAATLGPKQS